MRSKIILNNKDEITPSLIKELITKHKDKERPRIKSLLDYYINPNLNEFPAYIIDRTIDYFSFSSITYSSKNDFMLSLIKEINRENDEQQHNQNLIKDMCIYGTAYELLYFNKQNKITLCKLPVENVISIYDKNNSLISIITYAYIPNKEKNKIYVELYRNDIIKFYSIENEKISLLNKQENKLRFIPINIYSNELNGYGDFEKVLPYIEEYLKTDNIEDMTDLKKDIHRFSCVPDEQIKYFKIPHDEIPKKIKYKFLDLDDKCKKKERWFKQALYNRIKLIIMMSNLNPNTYNEREIKITFEKNNQ